MATNEKEDLISLYNEKTNKSTEIIEKIEAPPLNEQEINNNLLKKKSTNYDNSFDRILERTYGPVEIDSIDNQLCIEDAIAEHTLRQRKLLERPARQQVSSSYATPAAYTEGQYDYNIWYQKFANCREDRTPRMAAETRCDVLQDAGKTKADTNPGGNAQYYCYYFAKGCCSYGPNCTYRHRLPDEEDERTIGSAKDVFGRDKHADHRPDMGGVGTFTIESRTLYIGRLFSEDNRQSSGIIDPVSNLQKILYDNFSEWGPIETLRLIPRKSIGFVTYCLKVSAEFAKVAMADQCLGKGMTFIINVRWANEMSADQIAAMKARQAKRQAQAQAQPSTPAQSFIETKNSTKKLKSQKTSNINFTGDDYFLDLYFQKLAADNNVGKDTCPLTGRKKLLSTHKINIGPTTHEEEAEKQKAQDITSGIEKMQNILKSVPSETSDEQFKVVL